MIPRTVIRPILLIATGALALAGCSLSRDTYGATTGSAGGITVQATGSVRVVPDGVAFTFSIVAIEPTNEAAVRAVDETSARVLETLSANGVADEDVATRNITVYPEYRYGGEEGSPTLLGYRATQTFAVTITDAANAGVVVSAVLLAAGDAIQVDSVTPVLIDSAGAVAEARKIAVDLAKEKAADYARLADVKLGSVVTITEVASPSGLRPTMLDEVADGSKEFVTVTLGSQEVSVSIEIRFAIG